MWKVVYVDSSATGANNGTSWSDAFTNLQNGIAAARLLEQIPSKSTKGTYYQVIH